MKTAWGDLGVAGGTSEPERSRRHCAVVNRYNTQLSLGLTDAQTSDLVEFLKTL